MSATRGLVTDTISFSNVDGPGNRFVVFLQGCNFNCVACHNPYTINRCNNCGDCVATCPSGALSFGSLAEVLYDESVCTGGDTCLAVCPWDASPKAQHRSVDELLTRIRRAAPFLSGITVSGGEATLQADFVHDLFAAVKADPDPAVAGLTCFVDSNGAAPPSTWTTLAPVLDGAMIDLKCLDPAIHESMTGESNTDVLASIAQLQSMSALYEVRLLILAGINDDPDLLTRTARWLADVDPHLRVKVIGFRRHGARPHDPPLREPDLAARESVAAILQGTAPFDICVI